MGGSQPNNNVDLGAQAAQAARLQAQEQAQWQAEQNAINQAAQVATQQSTQGATDTTNAANTEKTQYDLLNAGQGAGNNATGGAAGIKAANTALTGSAGLSPADLKLQAAAMSANPTSLQSLLGKRPASSIAPPIANGLLSSSNVRLGG